MDESPEMAWLRDMWNDDLVKKHDNQWIAIQAAKIVAFDDSLETLLSRIAEFRVRPLLAFVYRGVIQ